jgi:hypothetical protein
MDKDAWNAQNVFHVSHIICIYTSPEISDYEALILANVVHKPLPFSEVFKSLN